MRNKIFDKMARKCPLVSNRKFGLVMGALLLFFAIGKYGISQSVGSIFLNLGLTFVLFAVLFPSALYPLNMIWSLVSLLNAFLLSETVLFLLFYFGLTPLGFLMRRSGRDPMKRNWKKDSKESFWIKREEVPGSMSQQF